MTNNKHKYKKIDKNGQGTTPRPPMKQESIMVVESQHVEGIALSNQDAIGGLNTKIANLTRKIHTYDNKMVEYHKSDVQPLIDKVEVLIDVLLASKTKLTKKQMKTLGLEAVKDESDGN